MELADRYHKFDGDFRTVYQISPLNVRKKTMFLKLLTTSSLLAILPTMMFAQNNVTPGSADSSDQTLAGDATCGGVIVLDGPDLNNPPLNSPISAKVAATVAHDWSEDDDIVLGRGNGSVAGVLSEDIKGYISQISTICGKYPYMPFKMAVNLVYYQAFESAAADQVYYNSYALGDKFPN